MFKKVEIWVLYLTIWISVVVAIGFGILVRQELIGTAKLGVLSTAALFLAEIPMNLRKVYLISDSLGELHDRFPKLDGFDGQLSEDEKYLLLARYNGDLRDGIVELVDLRTFEVIHTWNPDINLFNGLVEKKGEFKYLDRDKNNSRALLSAAYFLDDGSLIFKNGPLLKIDFCSNLSFQNTENIFHHSIETDSEENFWIPSRIYPQSIDKTLVGREISPEGGFRDDALTMLSADGEILFQKSVAQIFIENDMEYLLFSVGDRKFDRDPLHLNDIQPVNSNGKYWENGDVFISLRHQSMILLYRPKTNKIIWKSAGKFFHQHDVDIIGSESISIFNNNSKDFVSGNAVDGNNEVLIYNFDNDTYRSYLKDSLIENDVRTITGGQSEILENGDLFIGETNYSRLLYLNHKGDLEWTFYNRAEDGGVYPIGWSRILHTSQQIDKVKIFKGKEVRCDV